VNLRITNSNQNFVIGFNKIKGAFLYQNPSPDFLSKNGYFVSLLKSKNGLLIHMIHNGGEFFGSYPKPDTLDK